MYIYLYILYIYTYIHTYMRTTDDDAYFARGRPLLADPGAVNMFPAMI